MDSSQQSGQFLSFLSDPIKAKQAIDFAAALVKSVVAEVQNSQFEYEKRRAEERKKQGSDYVPTIPSYAPCARPYHSLQQNEIRKEVLIDLALVVGLNKLASIQGQTTFSLRRDKMDSTIIVRKPMVHILAFQKGFEFGQVGMEVSCANEAHLVEPVRLSCSSSRMPSLALCLNMTCPICSAHARLKDRFAAGMLAFYHSFIRKAAESQEQARTAIGILAGSDQEKSVPEILADLGTIISTKPAFEGLGLQEPITAPFAILSCKRGFVTGILCLCKCGYVYIKIPTINESVTFLETKIKAKWKSDDTMTAE